MGDTWSELYDARAHHIVEASLKNPPDGPVHITVAQFQLFSSFFLSIFQIFCFSSVLLFFHIFFIYSFCNIR